MYKVTDIRKWRMNAEISQAEMGKILDIPKRTIENWESGTNKPKQYTINLIIEKLMKITEKKLFDKMKKIAENAKSDENGQRPIVTWALISINTMSEQIEPCHNMENAIYKYKEMINRYPKTYNGYVACILCNIAPDTKEPSQDGFYMDKNDTVYTDHEKIEI